MVRVASMVLTLTLDCTLNAVLTVTVLGLAAALLALNFHHPANRAYALFVSVVGLNSMALTVGSCGDPVLGRGLLGYFIATTQVTALVYFASVFPRRRSWLPRRPWSAAPFLAIIAAWCIVYASDHRLLAGPPPGPLRYLNTAMTLGYVAVAVALAIEFRRSPQGPLRRSALLLVLAAPVTIFSDDLKILAGVLQGHSFQPTRYADFNAFAQSVIVLRVAAFLVLAGLLVSFALRPKDEEMRASGRRYLLFLCLVGVAVATDSVAGDPTIHSVLEALIYLTFPLLAAYTVLRQEIFDIDLKVRFAVKQSTIAAVFIGVFFVVSGVAEQFFASTVGPYLGIVAAGALVFALAPLQRAAERLAQAAVPEARPVAGLTDSDRAATYREQVRYAWSDGVLEMSERKLLNNLREHLKLSREEALRIEEEVTQTPGSVVTPRG